MIFIKWKHEAKNTEISKNFFGLSWTLISLDIYFTFISQIRGYGSSAFMVFCISSIPEFIAVGGHPAHRSIPAPCAHSRSAICRSRKSTVGCRQNCSWAGSTRRRDCTWEIKFHRFYTIFGNKFFPARPWNVNENALVPVQIECKWNVCVPFVCTLQAVNHL